ncbi:SPOR domain-containing protein [Nitrosomonas sp.]|uniref:SPOR domain-containing protein n=1 Tax=Nitrosomonas sp. TaxID=42353 RepID=UPI001D64BB02|nr:SPOR domain-containing protein [Nitrosomonas sp.]MBX3615989.1 SPOR domain-containing protein [Nitrosomonas sp.]
MNKNISEEELLLRKRARRRLVGAIVLVLISIIVLPAIFDEPKPETEQHEIAINLPEANKNAITTAPPIPEENFSASLESSNVVDQAELQEKSKIAHATRDENVESSNFQRRIPIPGIKPKFERHAATPSRTPAVAATTASAAVAPPSAPAVAAVVKAPVQAPDAEKGFVVQLGAFSDPDKAKLQQALLLSNGFKAYTESLVINGNQVTRVRTGPFPNRSAADSEIKKLKTFGLDGVVVPR